MQPTPENIIALYHQRGTEIYGDEKVTQAEHAIQSAVLAEREGASDEQILAALLA
jgi:predicted HD phosphohydrolase